MDVLQLLEELEDLIESGSTIPFFSKVMVDQAELLEIIKEIRIHLPDEMKQALWIKEERQRILSEAQQEGEQIIQEAKNHAEVLVDQDEIVQMARQKAEEIILQAQHGARDMRISARDYTDELLEQTGETLKEILLTIEENRNELKQMNRSSQ
ncbi:MAG: ATPase [Bacillota bacterium]|jgi:vacuolar-type H+-ATPase subunit H|nr:ATPase [Bacillota bacterium]MDW7676093.1 ATPase [Bacillota bacterium]